MTAKNSHKWNSNSIGSKFGHNFFYFMVKLGGRRLAYFFIVIVWLALMSFPLFAFFLATNGEIMIGSLQESHLRLFLINSDEHQGLGLERSRPVSGQSDCYLIEVKYLLWEGKTEKARAALEEAPQNIGSLEDGLIVLRSVLLDVFDGNYQEALAQFSSWKSEAFESQFYFIPQRPAPQTQ